MLLGDIFEESYNQFFLENESEEINENCEKGIRKFTEELSSEIKQNIEKMYKEKEEEKTYRVIVKYKNLNNEEKECELKFKSRFYPEEISSEEPEIEIEVNQKEIGLIAVDGVDKEDLAKESIKEFAKANAKVKVAIGDGKWLNMKGKLYLKIAGAVIASVAVGYIVYRVLPKEKSASTLERIKEYGEKIKDSTEKGVNIAKEKISAGAHAVTKGADAIKDKIEGKPSIVQQINRDVENIKESVIRGLEHVSKVDLAAGVGIGIVVAVALIYRIVKGKKTKKEMYELSILTANLESYMIVNEIIASKQKIKYESSGFFESIDSKLHELITQIAHFINTPAFTISFYALLILFSYFAGVVAMANIGAGKIKKAIMYIAGSLAILGSISYLYNLIILEGDPSWYDKLSMTLQHHSAFREALHGPELVLLFTILGIAGASAMTIVMRIMLNSIKEPRKVTGDVKVTMNDVEEELNHQMA